RFTLGVGIGAEYPLSALIAAEWSSTASGGRMLASVFAMQAVDRLLACDSIWILRLRLGLSR
ncbi:hypothetical protein B0T25DRAFT_466337, partial [Lasiosphaeria hispida]